MLNCFNFYFKNIKHKTGKERSNLIKRGLQDHKFRNESLRFTREEITEST